MVGIINVLINRLLMEFFLAHIQHGYLDMRMRIKQWVYWYWYWYWYFPVKMFFEIKGSCFKYTRENSNQIVLELLLIYVLSAGMSLQNNSVKLSVTFRNFNHICRRSFYRINWFFSVTTYSHSTSRVTKKEWRVFYLWMEVSISCYFHAF